jgi:prepilin-type N-terminal cleavage/methylation domain-containing protein
MRACENNNSITGTRRRGFTLIELLVVIALTALLLTLALKPLVDTFNLTSRSGTLIESQTAARDTVRLIRQTLGNAVYVFDNVQMPINIWTRDVNGNPIYYPTRFAVVQYVLPARQVEQFPGLEEIDPTTGGRVGNEDRVRDGFALPLVPGRVLGRMFVALTNNRTAAFQSGNNNFPATNGMPFVPYSNRFVAFNEPDNRYVLFRAEAPAFIRDPTAPNPQTAPYIPNLRLFHTVDPTGAVTDNPRHTLQTYDPNFFYDNSLAGGNGDAIWAVPGWRDLNGDGEVNISENWRAIATPLVPTNKADLIVVDRDPNNNNIRYDANGLPTVRPLIQFAPAYKENDPGTPSALNNAGNEAPNAAATVFTTQNANWATPFRVLVYLTNDNNIDPFSATPLSIVAADGSTDAQGRMLLGGTTTQQPNQPIPAVAALTQVGPLMNPTTGEFGNRNPQFAMSIDPKRGLINFEFPSGALLRRIVNGVSVPTPAYFDPAAINANLEGTWETRHLDLRFLNGALNGSNVSPLAPTQAWYNRIRIVPGSERIVGPDQRPGANYGYPVLYTRVSASAVVIGKNEYKINYEDAPNANAALADPTDPRLRKGYIQFNSAADSAGILNLPLPGNGQPAEDPVNGVFRPSGIPQLRANRATGQNEPAQPVEVSFSFQTNRVKDVVKVDYLTFEQMNIGVEMRLYDPRTGVPQSTSLADKTRVRNLQR